MIDRPTKPTLQLVAGVTVLMGVVACATRGREPLQEAIWIAWAGPLTGDVAKLGGGSLNGISLAFDEWNAKGGLLGGRKVVVGAEDDGCDPKQAGTVAKKIADDPKHVALIGPMCSSVTLAGSPIINKINLPQITLASNTRITQQGWKNLVRSVADDSVQGKAGVAFAMRKLGAKRFAILSDKLAFGHVVTESAKATVEKAGGTVTSYGGVEHRDVDYSAVLTKIIEMENADAILYCTNFATSAGLMVKQVRQLGFKKPIIGCDIYAEPDTVKVAGTAANMVSDTESLYFAFPTPPYSGAEAPEPVKQFAAKYKAKYGREPDGYAAYGYDVGNIVASAIQKAGSTDKQKILEVLHQQRFPGVLIPEYKFDDNGDVINGPMYIYTIDRGAFKLIEQFKE